MLDWYVGNAWVSIININNCIKEPTCGCHSKLVICNHVTGEFVGFPLIPLVHGYTVTLLGGLHIWSSLYLSSSHTRRKLVYCNSWQEPA